jgi:hypothetical protein
MKMSKLMKLMAGMLIIVTFASTIVSCDNKDEISDMEVISITLARTGFDLEAGTTWTLTATISPDIPEEILKWSSSNESVATVSSTGALTGDITAVAAGTTTITATASNNLTATCEITVRQVNVLGELVQGEEILIIAFGGAPFNELKATKHDMCWAWETMTDITRRMDEAAAAGIKLWVDYQSLNANPETAVNLLKDYPGFGGYMIIDEPSIQMFDELDRLIRAIQSFDSEHLCYVNLYPNYANSSQLGTSSYAQYIDQFAKLTTGFISFDNYPTNNGKGNVNQNWYTNMEIIRNAANKYDIPFWAYISSTRGSASDPPFTLGELSMMAYTNLAYGSQALQYFVFSGSTTAAYPYFQTPINNGQRTATYSYVQTINTGIKRLSYIFSKSKVLNVWNTGKNISAMTIRLEENGLSEISPVRSLKTSDGGAVISLIEKDNNRFLIIVNRSYIDPMTLTINVDENVLRQVRKDGTITSIYSGIKEVAPGDVAIYMWIN